MKATFSSRHGPSLGPGHYNPAYAKGIELKDVARPSSMFKSATRRMVAPSPSYNLSPGQYIFDTSSVGVRDKKRQNASMNSKKNRFAAAYGSHENRPSDGFSVVDMDNSRWSRGSAYVSNTSREGPEKMRKSEAPDVMYDWAAADALEQRIARMPKMNFTTQGKAKRFPEVITANPEHEPARMSGIGPGSYFKSAPKANSNPQATSSFRSGTRRFRAKKQPIVDFWGFNISQVICRSHARCPPARAFQRASLTHPPTCPRVFVSLPRFTRATATALAVAGSAHCAASGQTQHLVREREREREISRARTL